MYNRGPYKEICFHESELGRLLIPPFEVCKWRSRLPGREMSRRKHFPSCHPSPRLTICYIRTPDHSAVFLPPWSVRSAIKHLCLHAFSSHRGEKRFSFVLKPGQRFKSHSLHWKTLFEPTFTDLRTKPNLQFRHILTFIPVLHWFWKAEAGTANAQKNRESPHEGSRRQIFPITSFTQWLYPSDLCCNYLFSNFLIDICFFVY